MPLETQASPPVRDAVSGYDVVAPFYDTWHWQRFWSRNEVPGVLALAQRLAPWARSALDIGTGTGTYLTHVEANGLRGVAVDVSAGMLNILATKRRSDASLFNCDAAAIPLQSSRVDLGFLCRVLSHVRAVDEVLTEAARVIRPGGFLFMTDIDAGHSYVHTRVPTPQGSIFIRTYKHSLYEIEDLARRSRQWSTVHTRISRYSNLAWQPPKHSFPSIDVTGERAISFLLVLQRK